MEPMPGRIFAVVTIALVVACCETLLVDNDYVALRALVGLLGARGAANLAALPFVTVMAFAFYVRHDRRALSRDVSG